MAALSSLYADVRQMANQCPDVTIDKYLIESVREFCRDTWFYQENITMNIVASQAAYTLAPSASQEIISVDSVKVNRQPYPPSRLQDVNEFADYQHISYSYEPNSVLTLYPTPTANITNGLVVRVVIMPQEATTTIPDMIYLRFKRAIAEGALKYILLMQNESWTNPELASKMEANFEYNKNLAKGERIRGFVSRTLTVQPRRFLI